MIKTRMLPVLALVLTASCKDAPTSIYDIVNVAPATVVVSVDTVVATRTVLRGQEDIVFRFPVSVTNTGTDTLRLFNCSSGLEAKVDGEWISSGSVGCSLVQEQGGDGIPPGQTREMSAVVHTVRTPQYSDFTGTLPGEFRYRVGLTWTGLIGIIPNAKSNAFIGVLREQE